MQTLSNEDKNYLLNSIREVEDFPKPGIKFKDITTLLGNKKAFHLLMDHLVARYKDQEIDYIAGIESRGFIFGAALAALLKTRFVPIRKPGKLPYTTISEKYSLEYGVDEVTIHIDAFSMPNNSKPKVLLIDDLIATGGTATAAVNLINKAGAECVEACFVINLSFLQGDLDIKKVTSVYSVLEVD
ncbi:MAG: adenine phosphoribosyltransferase [Sulfurospirillaceae bacterium]|nr:adenine phosphoribosyltransferase [Sulfurospirillaceae bacterium]MDD2826025.1 adenine phosphoribosyltransferase [Sulfurospirillaceae bacterium]